VSTGALCVLATSLMYSTSWLFTSLCLDLKRPHLPTTCTLHSHAQHVRHVQQVAHKVCLITARARLLGAAVCHPHRRAICAQNCTLRTASLKIRVPWCVTVSTSADSCASCAAVPHFSVRIAHSIAL
jgi:hypothetical protein